MRKIILYGLVFCALGAALGLESRAARWQDGESAAVYYRDGVRYTLEGRLDEAATAFEQALRLDPKNGDAHYNLGNVYAQQGRWNDAVGAYRMAVFLKKKDGAAYHGLGLALAASGDFEQAAVAFRKAIDIYPAWAEPRFHLSQVYRKLGREEDAEDAYSEALERRPDFAANPPRSFMTETGKAHVEPRGQKAAAANAATSARSAPPPSDEPARRAVKSPTDDASALYELGLQHSRAARFEEAVASLTQAIRLDGNNAAAYSALGGVYAQLGRWRESVDAYEQAVRLDPRDANAYEMLGRSYAKLREVTTQQTDTPRGGETANGVRDVSTSGISADAQPTRIKSASATPDEPPAAERNAAPSGITAKIGHADPAAADADADPTAVYRVGPGDVLEVRVPHAPQQQSRTNTYKVSPTGLLDYPRLSVPLKVAGLTTDEIAARLASELKRGGATAADSEILVGVREFESHAIIVSGLVKDPGTKILRREGVPLYVIVAHAQPLPEAGRVLVVSQATGRSVAVNLADDAAMKTLARPGDVLTVEALPKQFVYVAGAVRQPGQKEFHVGLTLTQALMAAGGALTTDAPTATVTRQSGDGRLTTTRYNLYDIKSGRSPDPVMQPGDRVELLR